MLVMQKVVGSNPIIRFRKGPARRAFCCREWKALKLVDCERPIVPRSSRCTVWRVIKLGA
jgi:hypothetical protein